MNVAPIVAGRMKLTGNHAARVANLDPANPTATCLVCHQTQAATMGASAHYRWRGDAGGMSNLTGDVGKLGGMNDFCIFPDFNWLAKFTNLDGKPVDGGCAACHAGLGKKLDATELATPTLTNIDCLICHSKSYKRTVDATNGTAHFVFDTATMNLSARQAAADLSRPGRDACLRCHVSSGGGNNFKRGDIEPILADPPRTHDVHMSAAGANRVCVDCHKTTNHRIAGRGIDLREVDNPTQTVSCTMSGCHAASPHADAKLNTHTAKVACQTCHIPRFAKSSPTDMFRDYSNAAQVNAKRLYEPWIDFKSDQTPTYRWSNGKSTFYVFGQPIQVQSDGYVLMAGPNGDINDTAAKILPFKHHVAKQPLDPATNRLLPLKMGVLFQTGNIDQAIIQGAAAIGWPYSGYTFADTERFLGLYHGVAPKEQALTCAVCHVSSGQGPLDFNALGYARKYADLHVLCTQCHEDKSSEWSASQLFTAVHKKHVQDKRYDCSRCHNFTRG
ncbi:hypothetical protein [Desulfovibrio sp. TomC]|uniref:hypothetical protein n=1 Tax=Desulfovibrio sp. TomC TaxID=1562888 RepID=UPI0018CE1F7D|nr:hypothetical protein [Desulfovibrio sp. TomC]